MKLPSTVKGLHPHQWIVPAKNLILQLMKCCSWITSCVFADFISNSVGSQGDKYILLDSRLNKEIFDLSRLNHLSVYFDNALISHLAPPRDTYQPRNQTDFVMIAVFLLLS